MTTRAISTFTFVSSWIGFALDKSLVSMRDLCTRMTLQGINLNLSTFSKASKIRESEPFEKIIEELTKRLIAKKGKADARAMFPIDSTIITLTSKLLWEEGWHQVQLFSGLNSITTTVEGIVIHFGQGHDSLIRRENGSSDPRKWSGGDGSRVCFSSENSKIIRRKRQTLYSKS